MNLTTLNLDPRSASGGESVPANCADTDGLAPFDRGLLDAQQVDDHRVVLDQHGRPAARCSLWWRTTPSDPTHRIGFIGHYASASEHAGHWLLAIACDQLCANGCTLAIGPIDGSTWRDYRLVTERGSEPPFALEPQNPEDWPRQFRSAGFDVYSTYTSALCTNLGEVDPRLARADKRFADMGISLRPLSLENFEEDMLANYKVASRSFRSALLYTDLSEAEFMARYRAFKDHIQPELVLIAEREGETVGFVFMLPDFNCRLRGAPLDTAILKTVATDPDHAPRGLGPYLVGKSHKLAHDLGYRRVIHALMHDSNGSMNISRKHGHPMRHYALFAKELRPAS
jgi:GNAT superfamily N-acetyltransferase